MKTTDEIVGASPAGGEDTCVSQHKVKSVVVVLLARQHAQADKRPSFPAESLNPQPNGARRCGPTPDTRQTTALFSRPADTRKGIKLPGGRSGV